MKPARTSSGPAPTGVTAPADERPILVHLLGLAGLSRNVGFAVNKVFSAALLQSFHASEPVIGFILGMEGLFGLVLNPLTGGLSDAARRPGLRRKVYVLVALPAAALLWLWLFHAPSLLWAAVALTLFYAFQQAGVSPYHAWMPELVAPARWGVASGFLNLWWQLGNLLAFLVIPLVWTKSHAAAVWLTVVLIALGGIVTGLCVPERRADHAAIGAGADTRADTHVMAGATAGAGTGRAHPEPTTGLRRYLPLMRGNLLLYFIAQALAWLAFEAIASFFTLFIVHMAHGTLLDSALAMSVFTAAAMVAAPFAGELYRRVAPRRLLITVLALFGLIAMAGLVVRSMLWVYLLVAVEGALWSANLTAAYAWAVDLLQQATPDPAMAARMRGGLYGFSNFVQSIGLLVAAPVAGVVIRLTGGDYAGMFIVSCVAALGAAGVVALMRTPET